MYVSLKKAVYEVIKLSLIIPCYNEESNVEAFYNETEKAFREVSFDYEYVFVNDGSNDKTLNDKALDVLESMQFTVINR